MLVKNAIYPIVSIYSIGYHFIIDIEGEAYYQPLNKIRRYTFVINVYLIYNIKYREH